MDPNPTPNGVPGDDLTLTLPSINGAPGDDHHIVADDDKGVEDAEGAEGGEGGGGVEEQTEGLARGRGRVRVRVGVRVRVRVRVRVMFDRRCGGGEHGARRTVIRPREPACDRARDGWRHHGRLL